VENGHSIYIHIPFCKHRCSYCDFNTYSGLEGLISPYVEALCTEIQRAGAVFYPKPEAKTLFLGGGTPSLLPVEQLERIYQVCSDSFKILPGAEISLEANPGTLNHTKLVRLRQIGFNRISLGMQSAHPVDLALLERIHDTVDVIHSVEWATKAGFKNISLDLIFGIPGQSLERWKATLETALTIKPQHLSLYALIVEQATPFFNWVQRGLVTSPDEDVGADMYEWACIRLEEAGYVHYEISNWALESTEINSYCQHNLQYWRNLSYFGFGAGAHGYVNGVRTRNVRGVKSYIDRVNRYSQNPFPPGPAGENSQILERWIEMQETMMVGLRMIQEGVSDERFKDRFGLSLMDCFPTQVEKLTKMGLLEWAGTSGGTLRLTQRGWLIGNIVFREFVGLPSPPELKEVSIIR